MIATSLKTYLDAQRVKYVTINHSPAYTAQEVAHQTHIPGGLIAKTVMVMMDGDPAMAVLPANRRVDMAHLRRIIGSDDVRLAHEEEFQEFFPDCEVGALPPFGNLYDMPTYVCPEMTECKEVAFSAGSHSELIRMSWDDYERLVQPKVALFAV